MSAVQEIESAIERLDNRTLGQLSIWVEAYLAEKWEVVLPVTWSPKNWIGGGEAGGRRLSRESAVRLTLPDF